MQPSQVDIYHLMEKLHQSNQYESVKIYDTSYYSIKISESNLTN